MLKRPCLLTCEHVFGNFVFLSFYLAEDRREGVCRLGLESWLLLHRFLLAFYFILLSFFIFGIGLLKKVIQPWWNGFRIQQSEMKDKAREWEIARFCVWRATALISLLNSFLFQHLFTVTWNNIILPLFSDIYISPYSQVLPSQIKKYNVIWASYWTFFIL